MFAGGKVSATCHCCVAVALGCFLTDGREEMGDGASAQESLGPPLPPPARAHVGPGSCGVSRNRLSN